VAAYHDVLDTREGGANPADHRGCGGAHHVDELVDVDLPVVVDVANSKQSLDKVTAPQNF
jgi:hypothetical protein